MTAISPMILQSTAQFLMGPNISGRPPIDLYLERLKPDYGYGAATMPYVKAGGRLDTVSLDTAANLSIAQSSLEGFWKYYGKVRHDLGVKSGQEFSGEHIQAESQFHIQVGRERVVGLNNKDTHQSATFQITPYDEIVGKRAPEEKKLPSGSGSEGHEPIFQLIEGAQFLFGVDCGVRGLGKGFAIMQGVHWLGTSAEYGSMALRTVHRAVSLNVSNDDFAPMFKAQLGLAGTDGANMALGLLNILTEHEGIRDIVPPVHARLSPSQITSKVRIIDGQYRLAEAVQPFLDGIETDEYTVPAALSVMLTHESGRQIHEIIASREPDYVRDRPIELLISAGAWEFGFTLHTYPEQLVKLGRPDLVPVALQGLTPQ